MYKDIKGKSENLQVVCHDYRTVCACWLSVVLGDGREDVQIAGNETEPLHRALQLCAPDNGELAKSWSKGVNQICLFP